MTEPRVVYACAHTVSEHFTELFNGKRDFSNELAKETMFDTTEEYDTWKEKYCGRDALMSTYNLKQLGKEGVLQVKGAVIQDIQKGTPEQEEAGVIIYPNDGCSYIEGVDYDLCTVTMESEQYIYVDWIKGGRRPNYYIYDVAYDRYLNKKYSREDCPKCCGDGWYVGIFERHAANASTIIEENKLIQSFFKFVYTRKIGTYGSTLTDLPGKYNVTEIQSIHAEISSEIARFETYYRDKISVAQLDGYAVAPNEMLRSITIAEIIMSEETQALEVQLRFSTMAGNGFDVDLILPEESN